jgi:hypothetical protein
MPDEDLFISPLHCVQIGDEMVQAHNLLNGDTIFYDMTCDYVDYYHILLEDHAVIYSNNIASETLVPMNIPLETVEQAAVSNRECVDVC